MITLSSKKKSEVQWKRRNKYGQSSIFSEISFERISWLLSKVWKCFAFFTNQQTHQQRQRAGRQRSQFRTEGDFVGGLHFLWGFCWDQMFYVRFLLVSSNQNITRIRNHTGFLVDSHHSWEKKDSSSTIFAFLCSNIKYISFCPWKQKNVPRNLRVTGPKSSVLFELIWTFLK